MGFDIYLIAANPDAEEAAFDRSIAERAFEGYAVDTKADAWNLVSPDGDLHWAHMLIGDTPKIDGFSVDRPPFTERFWNAMFEVMRQTKTLLVWPGVDGPAPTCCIAHPDFERYMPPEVIENLGRPAVVYCGADIEAAIKASY